MQRANSVLSAFLWCRGATRGVRSAVRRLFFTMWSQSCTFLTSAISRLVGAARTKEHSRLLWRKLRPVPRCGATVVDIPPGTSCYRYRHMSGHAYGLFCRDVWRPSWHARKNDVLAASTEDVTTRRPFSHGLAPSDLLIPRRPHRSCRAPFYLAASCLVDSCCSSAALLINRFS